MSQTQPNMRIVPQNQPVAGERLDSWKEIASYLKRDVRTVQRWEKTDGLPIYRKSEGQKGGPVYAFAAEIDAWLHRNPPLAAEMEPEPKPALSSGWRTKGMLWAAASLFILTAGSVVAWRYLRTETAIIPIRVVPLTSNSGMVQFPSFSADGSQVAFTWNGPNQDDSGIYIKNVNGGEARPLTHQPHPAQDSRPAWSPNGQYIGFGRLTRNGPTGELLIVPSLGGAEQRIHTFRLPSQPSPFWPAGCWTPDSKWLVAPVETGALGLVSLETREKRSPTKPTANSSGDCCPAISHDGRTLAFLRASSGGIWNLYLQSLGPDYAPAGLPRQATYEPAGVENPMWTRDDREVLYITDREGERTLWRIPADGSRPAKPVEGLGLIGYHWAISPNGDRLAFQDSLGDPDIWRLDLAGDKPPERILPSSAVEMYPAFSPDGKKIAFVSRREKGWRLWVSESDGTNPVPLAPIIGIRPGAVRWRPNGTEIAFECTNQANEDICAVPSGGGKVRRVTSNPARDSLPSWSHDGKWIYVTSNRSGSFEIWKVPSDGSDAGAVQLTHGGGYGAQESEGYIYFAREPTNSTIWRIPAGGGEETQFGNFRNRGAASCFSIGRNGIYYRSSEDPDHWFEVWLCRFSDGKSQRIGQRIDKKLNNGLSVSPDDRWILFAAGSGAVNLVLVENFR